MMVVKIGGKLNMLRDVMRVDDFECKIEYYCGFRLTIFSHVQY
jgi:hypothetical protein